MLLGGVVIARSLIDELGDRRTKTLLALLEYPEFELAPADRQAYARFVMRLSEQLGPDSRAVEQLRFLAEEQSLCPEF